MRRIQKKAALEFTMTTVVVIVLAVIMLILGIVFIRSIMCAGIILGEDITTSTQKEIRSLFQGNDIGVKCSGQGGEEYKIGTGGRRPIACVIIVEQETNYELTIKSIESLNGAKTSVVEGWFIDQDWEGTVKPGKDGTAAVVGLLNVPQKAATTTLKLTIDAEDKDAGTKETIISYIDIVPVGWFKSAIC